MESISFLVQLSDEFLDVFFVGQRTRLKTRSLLTHELYNLVADQFVEFKRGHVRLPFWLIILCAVAYNKGMDEQRLTPEQQQASARTIKLGMTGAIIMLNALVFLVFAGRMPNQQDPTMLTYTFGLLAVMASAVGLWFASRARKGQPVAMISAATFELVSLLAFMYVAFLNTEAPLWILPATSLYSIVMIWLVVPGHPEQTRVAN